MKITNEQIIQSARRQRQAINSGMKIDPWRQRRRHGLGAAIAVAASLAGFIAGFGLRGEMMQPEAQPLAQNIQVQHDTITQVTTVRDIIYQTRVVTKYAQPLMAQQPAGSSTPAAPSSEEQLACSMLCDDIPYELLATP